MKNYKESKTFYGNDDATDGGSWTLANQEKIANKIVQFMDENYPSAHPFDIDIDDSCFTNGTKNDTINAAETEETIFKWLKRDVKGFICEEHSVNSHIARAIVNAIENKYINKMNVLYNCGWELEPVFYDGKKVEKQVEPNNCQTEESIRAWYDKNILPLIPDEYASYSIKEYIKQGYSY